MKTIVSLVITIMLTGCAGTTLNNLKSEKIEKPSIRPEEAVKCIRAALDEEMTSGSSPSYDAIVELEGPFRQCWNELDPIAKRMYAPAAAEAAMEQGLATVLEETCSLVIQYGSETVTGRKCALLRQAGLKISTGGK